MSDEFVYYGDTGTGSNNPSGAGMKPDTLMAAGQPGTPLPPRPARSMANNASRTPGINGIAPDDACDGVIDMEVSISWQV